MKQMPYMSTPYSTGRRLVEWKLQGENRNHDGDFANVIAPNIETSIELQAELWAKKALRVINPALLGTVDGFQQADYHCFWIEVIREYATTVLLAPDWQYSSGCVWEVIAGLKYGLSLEQIVTYNGNQVAHLIHYSPRRLMHEIAAAKEYLVAAECDVFAHDAALKILI